jgi:isoprenylcysteine carboxyl methyltransferase (ICMT) family protein YpbQ
MVVKTPIKSPKYIHTSTNNTWRTKDNMTFTILLLFFIVRLYSLKISINHTQQLIQKGAKEYGAQNSKYLALNHILIYVGAAVEALINKDAFSLFNGLGLVLLIAGYAVLFHVIKALGSIWTLKLFILPEHPIVKSGLYKITKHPNYYLNIVPELIGVLWLTHATYTSVLLLPYAYFLYTRIVQEEKMMNL